MTLRNFQRTNSTELSPNSMVFGREIDLSFDLELGPKDSLQPAAKEHFYNIYNNLKFMMTPREKH